MKIYTYIYMLLPHKVGTVGRCVCCGLQESRWLHSRLTMLDHNCNCFYDEFVSFDDEHCQNLFPLTYKVVYLNLSRNLRAYITYTTHQSLLTHTHTYICSGLCQCSTRSVFILVGCICLSGFKLLINLLLKLI